jgi:hypothetical protein
VKASSTVLNGEVAETDRKALRRDLTQPGREGAGRLYALRPLPHHRPGASQRASRDGAALYQSLALALADAHTDLMLTGQHLVPVCLGRRCQVHKAALGGPRTEKG